MGLEKNTLILPLSFDIWKWVAEDFHSMEIDGICVYSEDRTSLFQATGNPYVSMFSQLYLTNI